MQPARPRALQGRRWKERLGSFTSAIQLIYNCSYLFGLEKTHRDDPPSPSGDRGMQSAQ